MPFMSKIMLIKIVFWGVACVSRSSIEKDLGPTGPMPAARLAALESTSEQIIPTLLEIIMDYQSASLSVKAGGADYESMRKDSIRLQALAVLGDVFLSERRSQDVLAVVQPIATNPKDPGRPLAIRALGLRGVPSAVTVLTGFLADWCSRTPPDEGCFSAIQIASSSPDPRALAAVKGLGSQDPWVRKYVNMYVRAAERGFPANGQ